MIGGAVVRRLRQSGHEVVLAGRGPASGVQLDFNALPPCAELVRRLQGYDVLVNAVGIFQAQAEQGFDAVHVKAVAALFGAAVQAGIGRLVHVSALGAGLGGATAYFDSKGRAEVLLRQLPVPVTIVRPSLVYSPEGNSTRFFLRLARLPLLPLPGGGGQLVQPVYVEDLAEAIVRVATCVDPPAVLEAVGPRPLPLREYLRLLGAAHGQAPRVVHLPLAPLRPLLPLAARLTGGLVGPDSLRMLEAGNTGDAAGITNLLGRPPRDPALFVDAHDVEAGAALRLQRALLWLRLTLAAMWLATAWVSLWGYPREDSLALLARLGLHDGPALFALWSGAVLDGLLGLGMLVLPRRRLVYLAQLLLMGGYTVLITIWLPEFWLHPFGPLLKNIPIAGAIVALILLDRPHGPDHR